MASIKGSCLCGNIHYSSASEPIFSGVCHCKNCQKSTGTAFSIVVGVSKEKFKVEGKSLTVFQDIGNSGQPVLRHFCNNCGSQIYSELTTSPNLVFIKAGTLDDNSWLEPKMHVWWSSAQPWVKKDIDLPKFDKNPVSRKKAGQI